MNEATRGSRDRRPPGAMELLARARPASLDPPATAPVAEKIAARLVAAANAAGPPRTVPPRTQPTQLGGRAARTTGRARRIRRTALAGTGLTVTAAAAAVAVLVATAGSGPAPGRGAAQPVLLTAATVRQVAAASRSALARSGRAVVAYRTIQGGALQSSGTDNITFSGRNWNDVISQGSPSHGGRSGHPLTAINRIVNGQFYLYIAGRTRRLQWYHDTNPSGHPSFTIPDPRTVLRALSPSARFEAAGYQVIDGMRLKQLRATDLSHLTGLGPLSNFAPVSHVRSLEVWVDARGVVHRLSLTSVATYTEWSVSAQNLRKKANGTLIVTVPNKAMAAQLRSKLHRARVYNANGYHRIIVRVVPRRPGTSYRVVQVTALTVTFSGIGQPQHIIAPKHAIQQFGQG